MTDQPPIDQSPDIKKRKPRYWIWILFGFFAFFMVISWLNRDGPITEIPQGRFNLMVEQRVIKKIVLVDNEKIVEITLKPEGLQNAVYKQELEQANSPFGIEPNGPHYVLRLASVDQFYREFEEANASIPREDRVDVLVEERHDVIGMLINWMFLAFLIFGIVMIIRFFTRR